MLRRLVAQVASPVRWDLCMATMSELGVTGLLELPPAGTLTGIAKRNLKGVELFALNTPDQLPDARQFAASRHERRDGERGRAFRRRTSGLDRRPVREDHRASVATGRAGSSTTPRSAP